MGIAKLPEKVEHHFTSRTCSIFDRMLFRFGNDATLWLQYIDYLKNTRNVPTLNRVFAQAIQRHPTNEGLWILAADYEFEFNENITAARALMERALRLNSKSERLWIEFCKLECIYLARIKERMAEYGIDQSALVPKKGNSIDASSLPDAKADGSASGVVEGDPSTEVRSSSENPFLEGAIPRFIFQNALKAIPENPNFRLSFLRLFDAFEGTEKVKNELFQGLLRDFGTNPKCVSAYAQHKLENVRGEETEEAAVQFALKTYDEALSTVATVAMYQEYLDFCLASLNKTASQRSALQEIHTWAERVLKVCQKAKEVGCTSEILYSTWVDTLLGLGWVDEAVKTAQTATEQHPDSGFLWLQRIRLHVRRSALSFNQALDAKIKKLFAEALDSVPTNKCLVLWGYYLELVQSSQLTFETKIEHFRKALVALSAVTEKKAVSTIKGAFICRIAATHDIETTRRAYQVGLDVPVASEEYFRQCILIERSQRPIDLTVLRSLYRRAVRQHGKISADLWLGWIELEAETGDFGAAANVFWEAKKTLRKGSTKLLVGYRQLCK